jgi:signal transduction histidine kinase/HPt (histidine-containing phosphotransfer) domain-containing protein
MQEAAVRVLLVDDDEDEYVIVGDLLQVTGSDRFQLSWAPTYEQGLQSILSESCDVCLFDYRLGRRTGLDLLEEVTARPSHPQVILLTGEGDRGVDVTATKAGAADYLVKGGLTAADLERSIRYAVERGRILKALRDAGDLAQSMNLAKSAFLASMSHEIRSPMHAILGMADMLWETPLDADQRQYVEVFRRAGSDLLTLINEILDLSKIEAGYLELERVEFNLEDVVDQVIELAAVKARAKGLILLSHLAPGVQTSLIGDPTRLRQVLTNLLGNAVKFTASGEIVLSAWNHAFGKTGEIGFSVSDTGIGIPANKLETIFDDFTQAEAATTRIYGGTGLGLGISRRLVEAMGGSLTATSSAGVGSTFRFIAKFEVAKSEIANLETTPTNAREAPGISRALRTMERQPAVTPGDRRQPEPVKLAKILIADDSSDNQLLVQAYLRSSPYHLTFEQDGQAALDRFACTRFDLILMDVRMPGMDGLTAARAIRAMELGRRVPRTPILAMTAGASLEEIESSLRAGCDAHICKPTSKPELLNAIEKYRQAVQPLDKALPFEPIPIQAPPGLEDLVPGYLANRRKEVPAMLELLAASDFSRLALLCHNLKGTGGGYGFAELSRFGAALEQSAGQKDSVALREQMTELGDYLDKVQLHRVVPAASPGRAG